jgi:hypothetical protein
VSQYRRVATAEERAALEFAWRTASPTVGCLDSLGYHFMILFGLGVVGLLLGLAPATILKQFGVSISVLRLVMLLGFVAGFTIGIVILRKERGSFRQRRASYRRDFEAGEVEILHCTATGALKVEEFEDEGPGFFLSVEDSKVLFLQGQYLFELDESRLFPSSVFEVVRAPHSGLVLGVNCLGDAILPARTRGPFTDDEYVPENGELLSATFNSLDADLINLKKEQRRRRSKAGQKS